LNDGGLTDREIGTLAGIAEHITVTERRAMAAERDSTDRYVAAFMEDRIGQNFDARVTGVTRFGLFVRLADSGAEGLIPIRSLGADFFHHDEKRHALVGSRTNVTYGMGNVLAVKLLEAAPLTGGLRFALADGSGGAHDGNARPHRGRPGKRPGKDKFRGKKR
jgi:ribonuclease R